MSYNKASNEQRQAGSGVADKASGLFHIAHGAGENLRGTLLGAVDTIAKSPDGELKNEAIAAKGRAEMSRGMEVLKMSRSKRGYTVQSNSNVQTESNTARQAHIYPRTTETAGNHQSSAYADPNVYQGGPYATGSANGATGHMRGHENTTFPNHHRDDAISGLPPRQTEDLQALGDTTAKQYPDQYPSRSSGNEFENQIDSEYTKGSGIRSTY